MVFFIHVFIHVPFPRTPFLNNFRVACNSPKRNICDVHKDKIVYDASNTLGGSGGPLLNRNGRVIGMRFAILKGFGALNLADPARYAREVLK